MGGGRRDSAFDIMNIVFQANSDLQRFLEKRKSKGQEDEDSSPTAVDNVRKDLIFHKRIYGSVEALDGECQSEDRNRRFRIETCADHQVSRKFYALKKDLTKVLTFSIP